MKTEIAKKEIVLILSEFAHDENYTKIKQWLDFRKICLPVERQKAFFSIFNQYSGAINNISKDCDCLVSDSYSSPYCCDRQEKEVEIIDKYHSELVLDFLRSLEKKKNQIVEKNYKEVFKCDHNFSHLKKNKIFSFFIFDKKTSRYKEIPVDVIIFSNGKIEVCFFSKNKKRMIDIPSYSYTVISGLEKQIIDNFQNLTIDKVFLATKTLSMRYLILNK